MKNDNKNLLKLDQFYSSDKVVSICLNYLKKFTNDKEYKDICFLEPSAGNGQFIKFIHKEWNNSKILAFDIDPKSPEIKKADFLTQNLKFNKDLVTIGNPPFGHKASLAIDFINKSATCSNLIAFILPIQFERWNVQKQIDKNLKLIFSSPKLPKNSFVFNSKIKNINTIFQIWVNKSDERFENYKDLRILESPPKKHEDFILYIHNNTQSTLKYFNKTKYEWDFAIVRQGFYDYTQKIFRPDDLVKNRQYLFVKYVNPISKKIFNKINFQKLANFNTVIKGFSNTNVISEYNKIKKEFFNINECR